MLAMDSEEWAAKPNEMPFLTSTIIHSLDRQIPV